MEDPVANAILNQYFRRLEQALSGLPAERRTQIVEDLRVHVDECLRSEPDHSDAVILAILDRVGDPDEIAREALADSALPSAVEAADAVGIAGGAGSAGAPAVVGAADSGGARNAGDGTNTGSSRRPWLLAAPGLAAVAVAVFVLIGLTSGASPIPPKKTDPASGPTVHGRLVSVRSHAAGSHGKGWLPAGDISGDHASPGASDCSPQTTSGSESASALEAGASKVAAGSVAGHAWSLWSKNKETGANGLENGGLVVDGTAHGLCPGFPNPGEMEMLEPSGGGDGLAYGVIGYAGTAKVAIYSDTFGDFATTKLIAETSAQKVNGVGFFVTQLSESACDVPGVEMNTASSSYATEHNLAFASSDCQDGQLVPISDSQGIWELPTTGFPDKFQSARGGGALSAAPATKSGWLPAGDISGDHGSPGASDCSPQTTTGSESGSTLEADASKVASGVVDGHKWSLWSKKGQSGANGLETGGIVVDGTAHGLCPGFPNPGEMELLEPSGGGDGIAYGVVGYPGTPKVAIYGDTFGNFATTSKIASTTGQAVNGVGFFITPISESACHVSGIEMNTASPSAASEHNLAFSSSHCKDGQLVPISDSQGIWGLSPSGFPDRLGSGGGAGAGVGSGALTNGWLPAGDISGGGGIDDSQCKPQTTSGSEPASTLESAATKVASGSTSGRSWSLWSKKGQSGALGVEDGGLIIGNDAYGLCPGFPNPAEMEMLEPTGGGNGLAYGVIGYAGTAKVSIYDDTFGNFATTSLIASATAQKVNGVGFFITSLSRSACDVRAVEMNSASSNYAAEHNLAFSSSYCKAGQLVPISDSQGIWQLPVRDYPDKFQSLNGGDGSNSTPTVANASGVPSSHRVAAVLLRRYRILKTKRVALAAAPMMIEHMLMHAGPHYGLDANAIAEVHPARGVTMWLVGGTAGACGVTQTENSGFGTCAQLRARSGPTTTAGDPQGAIAAGFAPNGVTAVTVSLTGGRKLTVRVRDNAYFVQIPGGRIRGVRLLRG